MKPWWFRRLLCRLGLHEWSIDAAKYTTARLCNLTGHYDENGPLLEHERHLWEEAVGRWPGDKLRQSSYVVSHMADRPLRRVE